MTGLAIHPTNVVLRHIKVGANTDAGAVQLLNAWLAPQPLEGINGPNGWARGSYTRRRDQPGEFTITLPNAHGGDGTRHLDRFLITANRSAYRAGDEWIEVWRSNSPIFINAGELLFVGTPTRVPTLSKTEITIAGYDAAWLLNQHRETAAAFYGAVAPRSLFEEHTRVWVDDSVDNFERTAARFTLSNSEQTTADGAWIYRNCQDTANSGEVLLRTVSGNPAYLRNGIGSAHRVEVEILEDLTVMPIGLRCYIGAAYNYVSVAQPLGILEVFRLSSAPPVAFLQSVNAAGTVVDIVKLPFEKFRGGRKTITLERRHDLLIAYVDGEAVGMVSCIEDGTGFTGPAQAVVMLTPTVSDATVRSLTITRAEARTRRPFLMPAAAATNLKLTDSGDARLPVDVVGTGLMGEYFDVNDLTTTGDLLHKAFLPNRPEPYGRRIDQILSLNAAGWMTTGLGAGPYNGRKFAARWTGAIYLDLTNRDYAFRLTSAKCRARIKLAGLAPSAIGVDGWPTAGLSAAQTGTWVKAGNAGTVAPSGTAGPLNGLPSGWYPIVIEFEDFGDGSITTPALAVEISRSDVVGSWAALGASAIGRIAPVGTEHGHFRGESFLDLCQGTVDSWAYQWTVEPRSLESGEFPGRMAPRVRVGTDTDKVLDGFEGLEPQAQIDAEEVVQRLILDAQGLSEAEGVTQVTREAAHDVRGPSDRGAHLLSPQGYDSVAEISQPELAEQRALSLLVLKGSPWEEVGVVPEGRRELVPRFQMPNDLAILDWLPGDAIRLALPELGIVDDIPRPMLEVSWPMVPAGRGRPEAAFRQRPRDLKLVLQRIRRLALKRSRNYQGQLVTLTGNPARCPVSTELPDVFSRVSLPANIRTIVSATLVVHNVVAAGSRVLYVNNANTGITVAAAGRYDVKAWITPVAGQQRAFAQLEQAPGTGTFEYQLELVVAI